MRSFLAAVLGAVLAVILGGCATTVTSVGDPSAPTQTSSPATPAGLPPGFDDFSDPAEVPSAALLPLGGRVAGRWDASTPAGDAIVVAWTIPGDDPFAAPGGVAAWRRFDDEGSLWRPIWSEAWKERDGVVGVVGDVADLTGDGSDEALLRLEIGGSGACAHVRGVDLATGELVYTRDQLCDATIVPGEPGLVLTEALFSPGDAHCCPSQRRTSELSYAGGTEWVVTSETLTDL